MIILVRIFINHLINKNNCMKKGFFLFFVLAITFILQAQPTNLQDTLQEYTGKYKFPDGSVITEVMVTIENGVLTGSSAMGSSELRKTEGDIFEVVAYSGTATFKRNTENKIIGVHLVVGDIDIEGTKTEEKIFLSTKILFRN
jgi:hypothetical protein